MKKAIIGIINTIADAASSLIVDTITKNEVLIEQVSQKVTNSATMKNSITEALRDGVTQDVHQSLSFDIGKLTLKIEKLQASVSDLQSSQDEKLKDLHFQLDNLEQYGRRNCLLIHGIPEKSGENTDTQVLEVFNNNLKLDIVHSDLDRSHRLGRQHREKTRSIIVKFATYNIRSQVFRVKKHLKGSGISVTESLTMNRKDLYYKVKSLPSVKSAWTLDGKIVCLMQDGSKKKFEKERDLSSIT